MKKVKCFKSHREPTAENKISRPVAMHHISDDISAGFLGGN